MSRKLAFITTVAACALCFALVGCGGGSASSSASASAASSSAASSAASSSATQSSASAAAASSSAASATDNHNAYFVGKWDLYESDEYTHEQISQIMQQYASDEAFHAKMDEAYGRENVEFCARFNADGTGEIDTGTQLVSFTWEATNEGAVTFTSFDGKQTAMHAPVSDGKFTLNGDTYAKVG